VKRNQRAINQIPLFVIAFVAVMSVEPVRGQTPGGTAYWAFPSTRLDPPNLCSQPGRDWHWPICPANECRLHLAHVETFFSLLPSLGDDFRVWTYLLGGLSLAVTAWLDYRLFLSPGAVKDNGRFVSGNSFALSNGIWFGLRRPDGTMLFTALSLAMLEYFFSQVAAASRRCGHLTAKRAGGRQRGSIGLLGGIWALTRPEGLGLSGLCCGPDILAVPPSRAISWTSC